MRLKKIIPRLVLFSVALFGLAVEAHARRVRMAIAVPGKSEIVFVTAKEKGYYNEEGLDVELIVTGGINRLALIAGEVDFPHRALLRSFPYCAGRRCAFSTVPFTELHCGCMAKQSCATLRV